MTSHQKVKYVLGVETSCHDIAIGIIDSSKNIKANIVLNQNNYHKEFVISSSKKINISNSQPRKNKNVLYVTEPTSKSALKI